MKKLNFLLGFCLLSGAVVYAQNEQPTEPVTPEPAEVVWDVMDKNMAESIWNETGGTDLNKAWTFYAGSNLKKHADKYGMVQHEGDDYVHVYKYHAEATNNSLNINCGVTVVAGNAYTMEYEMRFNPIDKKQYPDNAESGWELNTISPRLFNKTCDVQFGYDAEGNGYVTLVQDWRVITAEDRKPLDIGNYHLYRMILSEDASTFDLYIDGELVYEKAATKAMNGGNILRLGSPHELARCDFDLKSAKMATGAWIPEQEEDDDDPVTTLEKEVAAETVSIYPTVLGIGGQFTVATQIENAEVAIFDLGGKQLSVADARVAVAPMVPGMYIVKVMADGMLVNEAKIVVTK